MVAELVNNNLLELMFHPLKSQLVSTDSGSKLLIRRRFLANTNTLSFPSKLTSHCSWHSVLKTIWNYFKHCRYFRVATEYTDLSNVL